MSDPAVEYHTYGVELMTKFAPLEEEHCAIAEGASPSTLLARVIEELAEAAFCQAVVAGDFTGHTLDQDFGRTDVDAAVRFLRVALAAVGAAARVQPGLRDQALPRSKGLLLEDLDSNAADWIAAREDWRDLGGAFFIAAVTALLKGAAVAACELDGLYEIASYEFGAEQPGDEDGEEDLDPATEFGESLFQAATIAVAAAEWFEERHQEDSVDEE